MEFNRNECVVESALNVEPEQLYAFYSKAFSNRLHYLSTNWKWLNRTGFNQNLTPLVLIYKNQIIAHAGSIPFYVSISGRRHYVSWYMDLKVLPEYQGKGLASLLTHEYMKLSECYLGFGNYKSTALLKKVGFHEAFNTFLHLYFSYPFNHPGIEKKIPKTIRRVLNIISYPFLYINYLVFSNSEKDYKLLKLSKESFNNFYSDYTNANHIDKESFNVLRDKDYFDWRVFQSPNLAKYYIYRSSIFSALISLQNNHGKYIDILWISDTRAKNEIRKMISTLGLFCLKNKYSYMRFFSSDIGVSSFLKNRIISKVYNHPFIFYSKDEQLFNDLKKMKWNIELIDNDWEHFNDLEL